MFGTIFYNRLPEFYRSEDANALVPYQLQNFLSILGTAFDEFYGYTQDIGNNFDTDNADSSVLSASIKMLGFKFPYAMTDTEKRELIKILPILYENKGNARVFEYLARLIFGISTTVDAYRGTTNVSYLNNIEYLLTDSFYLAGAPAKTIVLNVNFEEDLDNFNLRLTKFRLFAEEFRPVNINLIYNFDITHTEEASLSIEDTRLDDVLRIVTEYFSGEVTDSSIQDDLTESITETMTFEVLGDENSRLTNSLFGLTSTFRLTELSLRNTISGFTDSDYLIDISRSLDPEFLLEEDEYYYVLLEYLFDIERSEI